MRTTTITAEDPPSAVISSFPLNELLNHFIQLDEQRLFDDDPVRHYALQRLLGALNDALQAGLS